MVSLQLWSLFLLTTTLASLTPGPAVLSIVATALREGAARSAWAIAGILVANLAYLGAAGFGLKALFAASENLFLAIKWIGAAYLVWLGTRSLLGRSKGLTVTGNEEARTTSPAALFRGGFVLQATNPKAYLYVTAILPQFIDADRPILPQMAAIIPTSLVAESIMLALYAHAAARMRRLTLGSRFVGFANRAAGIMLITAGLLIASFGTR